MPNDPKKNPENLGHPYNKEKGRKTELSKQRTVLAHERTFNAWLRTGIASVVAGLGIPRLLRFIGSHSLLRIIGSIFVIIGAIMFVIGLWRYYRGYKEINSQNMSITPVWILAVIILGLFLSAIFVIILLIRTN